MEQKCTCTLCGEARNEKLGVCLNCRARLARAGVSFIPQRRRHAEPVVLLIGLADQEEVRRQLSELGAAAFILCIENTEEAKDYLLDWDGDAFFLLDSVVGDAVCLDFLAWLMEQRPTYGVFIGERISNSLAINGINSSLVVDVLLRPVSEERWRKLLERRAGHSGEDGGRLRQLKGRKPDWYDENAAAQTSPWGERETR